MKMQRGTVSAGGCIYPVKRPSSMAATGNNGLENGSGTSLYVLEPSMGGGEKGTRRRNSFLQQEAIEQTNSWLGFQALSTYLRS